MTLGELKSIVDQAALRAGHTVDSVRVRVVFKNADYEIARVRQFSVVPDVYIEIGEKNCEW